jgi:hypothetical protein
MQRTRELEIIGEIFSKEWKARAFEFIGKESENSNRFVSGYEIYRKFNVPSLSTAYSFTGKLTELAVFKSPIEGPSKAVRMTEFGKNLYKKLGPFL